MIETSRDRVPTFEAMPPPKTIIYGAGQMGSYYVKLLRESGFPADKLSIVDIEPGKAERLAGIHDVPDTREELAGIEAAIVASSTPSHASIILKLIDAGVRHILCEKPLAMDAGEVSRIREAAEAHGARVYTAFVVEFSPTFRRLTELMSAENLELSNLSGIWMKNRAASSESRPSAGDLEDEMVHMLSFALRLASQREIVSPISITADLVRSRYVGDAQARAVIRDASFPPRPNSGTNATIRLSTKGALSPLSMSLSSSFAGAVQRRLVWGELSGVGTNTPKYAFEISFDDRGKDILTITELSGNKTIVEEFSVNKLEELVKAFMRATKDPKPDARLADTGWAGLISAATDAMTSSDEQKAPFNIPRKAVPEP